MTDPLTAATDLVERLESLFHRAGELCPWPAGRQVRSVAACGVPFHCYYLPWRRARRGPAAAAPPHSPDAAERILARESLWRAGGLAVTPNLYPFSPRHLLLWEEGTRREPGPELLQVLLRVCAARPDLLGMVNTIGAAATVARAHAQLAVVPEARALAAVEVRWEEGPGVEVGFPAPGTAWPAFFTAFRGGPARVAHLVDRLLLLRRGPAFNILVLGERAYLFVRSRESCPGSYGLPLGALELAGVFGFEDLPSYEAMTGEHIARALAGTCWPPSAAAREAVLRTLGLPD